MTTVYDRDDPAPANTDRIALIALASRVTGYCDAINNIIETLHDTSPQAVMAAILKVTARIAETCKPHLPE